MNGSDIATLGVVCIWMTPYLFGLHLPMGESSGRRFWLSAAAGVSIAYVFVDLLPQMNRMQQTFTDASAHLGLPFPTFRVYAAAMTGFIVFYILENMVVFSRSRRGSEESRHGATVYLTHLIGFASYCGVMGYLLREEAERSALSLALYALALFVHFWIVDHALREEHGELYNRWGRWVVAAAIPAGWAVSRLSYSSDTVLPTLLGFIGGGVVINSLKEELPGKGEGRAAPFVIGAFGFALLILLAEGEGAAHVE